MTDRLLLIEANEDARWVGTRVGPKVHVLPIALMGLAAHARSVRPDLQIRILETSLDAAGDDALRRVIVDFQPTWIGVRGISLFIDEIRRVVAVATASSTAPLILGGPIAAAIGPRLFDQIDGLQFVALAEGEPILSALVAGTAPTAIPGLLARCQSAHRTSTQCAARPSLPRLDSLASPSYDLVDLQRYQDTLSYAYNHRRQGVLVTSRGCPFACTYCFKISSAPVRLQSADRVVSDIRNLYDNHGISDFYFVDDLFNLDRQRALQVFEQLVAARLNVRLYFVNGLRIDRCNEEFVERMIEAGTVWVTYAIESACSRIQTMIRKRIDLGLARRVIHFTQRQGIVVNINTMFGFPTETPDEAQMTLDYLGTLEHPSLLPYHFNLKGYPGCEIVDQAERSGWAREQFLATGFSSYGDLPHGSPTFSRHDMIQHLLTFHAQYGLANRSHLTYSLRTLRNVGYSDGEIVDMYTVLMNRPVHTADELTSIGA